MGKFRLVETSKSHSIEWLFCIAPRLCYALLLVLLIPACERMAGPMQLAGSTMGTTWHLTYHSAADEVVSQVKVQQGVQRLLEVINDSMSTYAATTEISRFNQQPLGREMILSGDFVTVLQAALDVGEATQGAYDVTVGPLVDLWGFGPTGPVVAPPTAQQIAATRTRVGQRHIQLDTQRRTATRGAAVALDFSSLAKGYAVDRVAQWLEQQGIDNYLFEVGGEMRLAGSSPRGGPWRVAIEQPEAGQRDVAVAIEVTDQAVATSGDYRNFFEVQGKRYSHTIDPRTGYPVAHDVVSVTVVHPQAMLADAWATAMTVLGAEDALALADSKQLAVYVIQRGTDGLVHRHSAAFVRYLSDT